MGMTPEGFLRRLRAGKAVNCPYRRGEMIGMISAWPHGGQFLLSWEECRESDQNDWEAYTRDELHEFETPEEVLAFVEQNSYPASAFSP